MNKNQYDTDVCCWSPKGRLFQVEYATEAVKQGSAAVGATSKTHSVLVSLKRSPSELAKHQEKTFVIDDHMGIAIAGLTADARSLCKFMRTECLNHRFVFDSALQAERLVEDVANKQQECTHSYVRRPYGVGLLIAAYDKKGAHLYQTNPDGNYWEYRAMAIGARCQSAKTYLEKHFESFPEAPREELIRHAVLALNSTLADDDKLSLENLSIGVVGKGEDFHVFTEDELAPFLEGLEGRGAGAGAGAAAAAEESKEPADIDMDA